jgi:superfamily II DNA or RNA helicase
MHGAQTMLIRALGNRVEVHDAPEPVLQALRTELTLSNPRYIGAVRSGKTPIGIDKVLRYYTAARDERHNGLQMRIPAACAGIAARLAKRHNVRWELKTDVRTVRPVPFQFHGALRLYQVAAVADVMRYDHGILHAPTGSGKTVMGCAAIAERGQPAMIVVHNRMLQAQWLEAIQRWLGLDAALIGGDRPTDINAAAGRPVIVAIINSLSNCAGHLHEGIGHLIVDECHRCPAESYARTLRRFDCRYRLGLSATPYRRDGLDDAIKWALGRIVKVARGPLVAAGAVLPAAVRQIGTQFTTEIDASEHYQAAVAELTLDPQRNQDIVREARLEGQTVIVLSDRRAHVEELARLIPCAVTLHGQLGAVARRKAEARITDGTPCTIVATTQLIGEGFDLPAAQTLILATPIKWSGRLLQAMGRVLRPSDGKTAGQIVDFCDWRVPVLAAGARARAQTYAQLAQDERGS